MAQSVEAQEAFFVPAFNAVYTLPWRYLAASEHSVALLDSTGVVARDLVLGVDFAVSPDADTPAGTGSLTLLVDPAVNEVQLRVRGAANPVQLATAEPGTEAIVLALDRYSIVIQQLVESFARIDTSADKEAAAAAAVQAVNAAAAAALSAAAADQFDPANYQPVSQILSAIAGLALTENRGFYATSENEFAPYDLTAAGRAITGAANAAAQLQALGLSTGQLCGVGEVSMHLRGTVPAGKLELNGGSVLHNDFPVLGTYLGTSPGDTIILPDMRGEGVRGWDNGRGVDSGRLIASAQPGQLATHKHATVHFTNLNQFGTAGVVNTTGIAQTDGPNIQPAHLTAEPISTDGSAYIGGPENLMRNVAFMFCVQTEA